MRARIAGRVCTKIMFFETVRAPNIPAIAIQAKKNVATFRFHSVFLIKNKAQIKPAAHDVPRFFSYYRNVEDLF